jgi:hypothetical protein
MLAYGVSVKENGKFQKENWEIAEKGAEKTQHPGISWVL